MTRYIAFLRGINAGRVIKMTDLKECFESLGLKEVKTVLQTGNVIFESDKDKQSLKKIIEQGMSERYSFDSKVQIYSFAEINKIIEANPFKEKEDMHNYVIFLEDSIEASLVSEDYMLADNEKVQSGNGVVYWQVSRGDTLSSSFARQLAKNKYKLLNTARNLNTVKRIVTK
jgi:uncharacterized protein (DUF1697 family)